ncbi:hypothetical protein FAF44_15035 [Nonomuraea sp. MG754425]|uniref:alpha/beta hydrolase n=1 Tax=Nonomuraea sp. MG754425 TaxID=2570319 RepID=UPI001F4291EC|nr:alpha/beta hydrolase-fold protein [Nonomuraea sp. MG754425]MCF6469694.1 hypothetical protein [Nonomuraea sp. MG754425]
MPVPRWIAAGALAVLAALALTVTPGQTDTRAAGTLATGSAPSPALREDIAYNVYLPARYDRDTARYPVLYLLHGRGDSMQAWTRVRTTLDDMIRTRRIPPVIAVMPDAPWSERGNWYVDSRYTGDDLPGRPVETALTRDLVKHVDATYRTAPIRQARLVGGYSMGGAGALRFALAHQDLFGAAAVLSPAVYTPLPPSDSSARDYGAFGRDGAKFSDRRPVQRRQARPRDLRPAPRPGRRPRLDGLDPRLRAGHGRTRPRLERHPADGAARPAARHARHRLGRRRRRPRRRQPDRRVRRVRPGARPGARRPPGRRADPDRGPDRGLDQATRHGG